MFNFVDFLFIPTYFLHPRFLNFNFYFLYILSFYVLIFPFYYSVATFSSIFIFLTIII